MNTYEIKPEVQTTQIKNMKKVSKTSNKVINFIMKYFSSD